jgi:hypothetical protein
VSTALTVARSARGTVGRACSGLRLIDRNCPAVTQRDRLYESWEYRHELVVRRVPNRLRRHLAGTALTRTSSTRAAVCTSRTSRAALVGTGSVFGLGCCWGRRLQPALGVSRMSRPV